jgi:hypothetical protein
MIDLERFLQMPPGCKPLTVLKFWAGIEWAMLDLNQ